MNAHRRAPCTNGQATSARRWARAPPTETKWGGAVAVSLLYLFSPQELLRPQFAIHFDDHICRDVQPSRRLPDRLSVGRFVQAVSLLFVGAEKRKQPLHTNVRVDLRER